MSRLPGGGSSAVQTCRSTFKYFIISIVSTNYTLCISWIIKFLAYLPWFLITSPGKGWQIVWSCFILSHMQTDVLLHHKAVNLLWMFPCLDESVRSMEFKAVDSTTSWQLWSDVQIKGLSTMENIRGVWSASQRNSKTSQVTVMKKYYKIARSILVRWLHNPPAFTEETTKLLNLYSNKS